MKKSFLIIFSVMLVAICGSCGKKNNNALIVGSSLDGVISLDPAEVFEVPGSEYIDNTYSTLVVSDPKNPEVIMPNIAESWEISADQKTLTFKIKPGIKFASGNVLTAHDVAFSLQRAVLLKKNPSEIISQFGFTEANVKEKIRATDNETVVFEMDDVYASTLVLYCLTSGVASIVDQKEVISHEVDGDLGHGWLKTHHAGCGPFKLKVWKPKEILSMEAHAEYFKGAPKLKEVIYQHIAENATALLMLEKGDIDLFKNLGLTGEQISKERKNVRIERIAQGSTRYLLLNQKVPALRIPEVRQAIRHLIDYNGIVEATLKGEAFVHQTFIPQGYFGALNENPYDYNVEKARALLEKVGLLDKLTLTLETQNAEQGQMLQSSFENGGITLKISQGDSKQLLTKYRERNYELGLAFWMPDYFDPHTNATTFSRNPDNDDTGSSKTVLWRSSWFDPELNTLTEQAKKEGNAEKRKALYHELQRKLLNSSIVNLFQYDRVVLIRNNVHDIDFIRGANRVSYERAYKA